jgi:GT2 family glycosyltransferase
MIGVLTITNGRRWHLLSQTLTFIKRETLIKKIIIVNNAVPYNLENEVKKLDTEKIIVITMTHNIGSAGAFKKGLKFFYDDPDLEFIFLLDDDNLPNRNGIISGLLNKWRMLSVNGANKKVGLLTLRNDRKYLNNVVLGEPIKRNFPNGNLFLGFGIIELPQIVWYKIFKKLKCTLFTKKNLIKIPMAPFGGLFIHKSLLNIIGYPDERFFLYVDDFEWTHRITMNKGEIWLIADFEIIDTDIAWINSTKQTFFHSRYLEQGDFKSYISVRNYTYFAKNHLAKIKILFIINIVVYLIYVFVIALFRKKLSQYKLFISAIRDGWRGNFQLPLSITNSNKS